MKLFDITFPIRESMVTWEGDPGVRLERVRSLEAGELCNISRLDFGVHTGTHVDAPIHFSDGAEGADALPLEAMIGPANVVDATQADVLDRATLAGLAISAGSERLLFKTPSSDLWAREEFVPDFVELTGDGAEYLVARHVKLVGIDYLLVGDDDAHRALLGAGVVALEGLDLREVEPGKYQLVCLPLRIVGSDGAPARAILIRD
jgi:arylformamidase